MKEGELHSVAAPDEPFTCKLAAALARQCREGDCILLRGDLGSGKTTFARGFIQTLASGQTEIVSPTFNIVQTYPAKSGAVIWHFDLYRLRSKAEIIEIGLDEALQNGITLIEWPELVEDALPAGALDVTIALGDTEHQRTFIFAGLPEAWQDRLQSVKDI